MINLLKIKATENFTIPNHPAFKKDAIYFVEKEIAQVIFDRNLGELVKEKEVEKTKKVKAENNIF